jgi:hypothetical protein
MWPIGCHAIADMAIACHIATLIAVFAILAASVFIENVVATLRPNSMGPRTHGRGKNEHCTSWGGGRRGRDRRTECGRPGIRRGPGTAHGGQRIDAVGTVD